MSTLAHEGAPARAANDVRAMDWGILFLRLAVGAVFFAHGGQKLFGWFGGHGLEANVAGFAEGGIPAPLGYLVAFTEFFGGLWVITGAPEMRFALGSVIFLIVAHPAIELVRFSI